MRDYSYEDLNPGFNSVSIGEAIVRAQGARNQGDVEHAALWEFISQLLDRIDRLENKR